MNISLNTFEYLSLLFALISVLTAIIAISQGIKNYKLQREIAQLQGVYSKSELDLQIFDKPIVKDYFYAFPS